MGIGINRPWAHWPIDIGIHPHDPDIIPA